MVCSLSPSKKVHYVNKRNSQEACIEFNTASISGVLCKWSTYACSFETYILVEARNLLIRNNAIAKDFKENTTACNPALNFIPINAALKKRYDYEEHVACVLCIHGNVHHLISFELISDLNNIIRQLVTPHSLCAMMSKAINAIM